MYSTLQYIPAERLFYKVIYLYLCDITTVPLVPGCTRNKCTAKTNAENLKQIFPEKELRGHSPNFHIHVSVSDLYIPTIDLAIFLQEICGPILGIYKSLRDT
jgi:hypothetical protein